MIELTRIRDLVIYYYVKPINIRDNIDHTLCKTEADAWDLLIKERVITLTDQEFSIDEAIIAKAYLLA